MSYNWKYCSFYPNNFGASALPRSEYACTSVGVHMYLGRGTITKRFLSHNFQLPFKQQLSLHEPLLCVVLIDY